MRKHRKWPSLAGVIGIALQTGVVTAEDGTPGGTW